VSTLAEQIRRRAHAYVRKGSKANRRLQVRRLLLFAAWVEEQERVGDLGRLGKRHVIRFWAAHQHWSDKTRYGYWLAFCTLWQWLGKAGEPPRPFKSVGTQGTAVAPDGKDVGPCGTMSS